jgi:hypothetical protein
MISSRGLRLAPLFNFIPSTGQVVCTCISEYSDQRCYNYNKAVVYCDLSEAAMVEIGGLHNKDTRIVNKMVRLFQRTIRA